MERRRCDSAELNAFVDSGVYKLDSSSNVIFVDPVRLLNESYSRFCVSPSTYYSRLFPSQIELLEDDKGQEGEGEKIDKKRKRKAKVKKKRPGLNERELCAERRHQEVRPLLLDAHEKLLEAIELVKILPEVIENAEPFGCGKRCSEHNFVVLGSNWRANFCEISLPYNQGTNCRKLVPLFNNVINIDSNDDLEAEFQDTKYILPQQSKFLMSDLKHIRKLVPDKSTEGYNLIVIDPPWENASARQKSMYPTLPNKYFLSLPIKELACSNGALVALWLTNREKLHDFVFNELFPSWGVTNIVHFYWLKVKKDGLLIGDLDLFHHRPYECLLLGYINVDFNSGCIKLFKKLNESKVIISIPGAYSRKPPLSKILSEYIPGKRPSKCVELFARELLAGWTSWGNEPLHFQDSFYFSQKLFS